MHGKKAAPRLAAESRLGDIMVTTSRRRHRTPPGALSPHAPRVLSRFVRRNPGLGRQKETRRSPVKTPKARTIRPRGTPWILGLIGILILVPLALVAPLAAAVAVSCLAIVGGLLLWRRLSAIAAAQEIASREIGVISQRLVKLEAVAAALVQGRGQAAATEPPAPSATPALEALDARLNAGIEEVTAEIGILSGIVRELAAVVAAQDADIAGLKTARPAPAPARPTQTGAETVTETIQPAASVLPNPEPVAPPMRLVPRTAPPVTRAPDPLLGVGDERSLIDAFDGEGLEVYLQPVVTLPQRKVVAYEALARLKIGEAVLAPESFLPVLERHGRTTALDRRMLQRVATIARHLQGRGSPAAVSYSLTPHSLYEPGFLRTGAALRAAVPGLPSPVYRFMFSTAFTFGLPPTEWALDSYLCLLDASDPGAPWMIAGLGVELDGLWDVAMARGGHMRVGLEDAPPGCTRTNAEMVAGAHRAVHQAGQQLATASEVRRATVGSDPLPSARTRR